MEVIYVGFYAYIYKKRDMDCRMEVDNEPSTDNNNTIISKLIENKNSPS